MKSIQVYVSQLRQRLGAGMIVTRPPGYVLARGRQLDLHRFERLVAGGAGADPASRAVQLREALALWRGPPFADFTDEPFARVEDGAPRGAAAGGAGGAHRGRPRARPPHGAGRGARTLVAEQPQRERLRGQLMLALYRSGRQAEALEAYQGARRRSWRSSGSSRAMPCTRLRGGSYAGPLARFRARLATAEPESRRRRRPACRHPRRERAAAQRALSAANGRSASCADPRAGHLRARPCSSCRAGSRDRQEPAVRRVRPAALGERGRRGCCGDAAGRPAVRPPTGPGVQSLAARTSAAAIRARLRRSSAGRASDVAQLVPEIRELLPGVAAPRVSPRSGHGALPPLRRDGGVPEATAARDPLVLVLDDLHAADTPSLLLLRSSSPRSSARRRILVVCGYRDRSSARGSRSR